MTLYEVDLRVTTRYVVEVEADDQAAAMAAAKEAWATESAEYQQATIIDEECDVSDAVAVPAP